MSTQADQLLQLQRQYATLNARYPGMSTAYNNMFAQLSDASILSAQVDATGETLASTTSSLNATLNGYRGRLTVDEGKVAAAGTSAALTSATITSMQTVTLPANSITLSRTSQAALSANNALVVVSGQLKTIVVNTGNTISGLTTSMAPSLVLLASTAQSMNGTLLQKVTDSSASLGVAAGVVSTDAASASGLITTLSGSIAPRFATEATNIATQNQLSLDNAASSSALVSSLSSQLNSTHAANQSRVTAAQTALGSSITGLNASISALQTSIVGSLASVDSSIVTLGVDVSASIAGAAGSASSTLDSVLASNVSTVNTALGGIKSTIASHLFDQHTAMGAARDWRVARSANLVTSLGELSTAIDNAATGASSSLSALTSSVSGALAHLSSRDLVKESSDVISASISLDQNLHASVVAKQTSDVASLNGVALAQNNTLQGLEESLGAVNGDITTFATSTLAPVAGMRLSLEANNSSATLSTQRLTTSFADMSSSISSMASDISANIIEVQGILTEQSKFVGLSNASISSLQTSLASVVNQSAQSLSQLASSVAGAASANATAQQSLVASLLGLETSSNTRLSTLASTLLQNQGVESSDVTALNQRIASDWSNSSASIASLTSSLSGSASILGTVDAQRSRLAQMRLDTDSAIALRSSDDAQSVIDLEARTDAVVQLQAQKASLLQSAIADISSTISAGVVVDNAGLASVNDLLSSSTTNSDTLSFMNNLATTYSNALQPHLTSANAILASDVSAQNATVLSLGTTLTNQLQTQVGLQAATTNKWQTIDLPAHQAAMSALAASVDTEYATVGTKVTDLGALVTGDAAALTTSMQQVTDYIGVNGVPPTFILTQPQSVSVESGTTTTFSITTRTTAGVLYQWEKSSDNGVSWTDFAEYGQWPTVGGATSAILTLTNTSVNNNLMLVRAKARTSTLNAWNISASALVQVQLLTGNYLTEVANPTDINAQDLTSVTFQSAAIGSPSPTAVWEQSPTGEPGTWQTVPGSNSGTVLNVLADYAVNNNWRYRATWSNGSILRSTIGAVLTISVPTISITEFRRTDASSYVYAICEAGGRDLSYQWEYEATVLSFKIWVDLQEGTNTSQPNFVAYSVQSTNMFMPKSQASNRVRCRVSNPWGVIYSATMWMPFDQ